MKKAVRTILPLIERRKQRAKGKNHLARVKAIVHLISRKNIVGGRRAAVNAMASRSFRISRRWCSWTDILKAAKKIDADIIGTVRADLTPIAEMNGRPSAKKKWSGQKNAIAA